VDGSYRLQMDMFLQTKLLPPGSYYAKNAFAVGALPRAPVGELAVLPSPPSCCLLLYLNMLAYNRVLEKCRIFCSEESGNPADMTAVGSVQLECVVVLSFIDS